MTLKDKIERIMKLRDSLRIKLMGMDLVGQSADFQECVSALADVEVHGYRYTPITDLNTFTIQPGYYPEGSLVKVVDHDLIGENIKPGVSILGVEGAMPRAKLDAPEITIDSTNGIVSASAQVIEEGYADSTTFNASAKFLSFADSDLKPENIKKDVTIFGVTGNFGGLPDPVMFNLAQPEHVLVNFEYVDFDGNYQVGTMPSQGSRTIIPSTSAQIAIPARTYAAGAVTVAGDSGLIAANIKKGVTIFNVAGTFTEDATASAGHILSGKTAYVNGVKVTGTIPSQSAKTITPSTSEQTAVSAGVYTTGTIKVAAMPTATQATPSISLDTDTGLITATCEQSAGYVDAGRTSAPYQLPTRGERLITPGTNPIGILAGQYLTGDQTIAGSVYLVPENIKKGVSIFGVAGTYTGSSSPSDFTPSSGATVNVRPSGTLDGTSLWCNYAITPVGYSSDYAIFEYTLTAGTSSTTGSSAAGNEEYSALIRFSGTNIEERTYCVIVKSWNTAWNKGSTAARFTESGFFAIPITGVPSSVTVLSRFKTTAVSNVASATGTVTF